MTQIREFITRVTENVENVIVGKREAIELVLVALLCEGHLLIDDVPGVGKTMLARAVAASLGGSFKRIQCTPDLLPNDITGVSIYNQKTGEFDFQPGPVFVNILLADEINRATPRTQSALLEAMQEQQVTVDGVSRELPAPFLVIATQNPVEYEGTFPLPEAQLDRFLLRIVLGYPGSQEEQHMLTRLQREHPITRVRAVAQCADLLELRRQVWEIHVDETIQQYVVAISSATRHHPDVVLGASPRASLALFKSAQALAAARGRDHVIPEDVQQMAEPVLAHRLKLRAESELRGKQAASVLREVIESTPLKLEE